MFVLGGTEEIVGGGARAGGWRLGDKKVECGAAELKN